MNAPAARNYTCRRLTNPLQSNIVMLIVMTLFLLIYEYTNKIELDLSYIVD